MIQIGQFLCQKCFFNDDDILTGKASFQAPLLDYSVVKGQKLIFYYVISYLVCSNWLNLCLKLYTMG